MKTKLKYEINENFAENLCAARGIDDFIGFMEPQMCQIENPINLNFINYAVQVTEKMAGCKALTIVDSDCDGQCASAILLNYLKKVYPNWEIDYYVHEKKSHGLEDAAVDPMIDLNQYELIFVPDAGSNDDKYFKEYPNIQFIVLDHHIRTVTDELPSNAIIVNNQESSRYLNKSLSGAGVTWQFCKMIDSDLCLNYANEFMDLAAVAIIGDVMDITTPENRAIISYGLKNIKNGFLSMLIDNASYSIGSDLTPISIAFYIVPAINSMCRVGTIEEKRRMFLAFIDPEAQVECHKRGVAKGTMVDVAIESARECTNTKAKQKRIQEKMAELCEQKITENDMLSNKILIFELGEEFDDIPTEMNGLAATKISNDYNHPTLIGRVSKDGHLRGSIRGLSTIDMPPLKDFLMSSGKFDYCEGHQLAAGFSIPASQVESFTEWANQQLVDVDMTSNTWFVDFSINAAKDSEKLKQIIGAMDNLKTCWGQGFPEALIHVTNICVGRGDISVMGKATDTVKISKNGISYMFFKRDLEEIKKITQYSQAEFEIVGTANMNVWNGRYTPQIFVSDYIVKDNSLGF